MWRRNLPVLVNLPEYVSWTLVESESKRYLSMFQEREGLLGRQRLRGLRGIGARSSSATDGVERRIGRHLGCCPEAQSIP